MYIDNKQGEWDIIHTQAFSFPYLVPLLMLPLSLPQLSQSLSPSLSLLSSQFSLPHSEVSTLLRVQLDEHHIQCARNHTHSHLILTHSRSPHHTKSHTRGNMTEVACYTRITFTHNAALINALLLTPARLIHLALLHLSERLYKSWASNIECMCHENELISSPNFAIDYLLMA